MKRYSTLIVLAALGAWMAVGGDFNRAAAEDFRIDNAVFVGEQKTPAFESTTIFYKGIVYDCMKSPEETVVFEKSTSKFILLNLKHRSRAELTTGEVAAFTDRLQQDGTTKNTDPLVKFLSSPKFEEHFDEAAGELTLFSPLVSYRLTLLPESNPATVEEYHGFSDGYALLNAMLTPGSRPPFGRLLVNAALAKRQSMASQVILTFTQGKATNRQQITIRSTHSVVRTLASADLELVAKTREYLGGFKLVSFDQYLKIEQR